MVSISVHTDDFIPRMFSAGILAELETFATQSRSPEQIQAKLAELGYSVTWEQFKQYVSDVLAKGELTTLVLDGDDWPEPTGRPNAVSGIGIGNGNVWASPPGDHYIFRFYVNGILKLTLTDYYITSLESIGAESGDTIQICQVAAGVVGWWAEKNVP